jgi:hypothetical protein
MRSEGEKIRALIRERQDENEGTLSDREIRLLGAAAKEYREHRSSHEGRFPFELLQNAHDSCVKKNDREGTVWYVWTEHALLVADSGSGFTVEDVGSITDFRSGHKESDSATIGHKGLGFVACYDLTDTPQIITHHGVSFGFDLVEANKLKLPPMTLPELLSEQDYENDIKVVESLRSSGAKTIIRLPFNEAEDHANSIRIVKESLSPEILLFMPKLRRLVFENKFETASEKQFSSEYTIESLGHLVGPGEIVRVSNDEESQQWLLAKRSVAVNEEISDLSQIGDQLEAAIAIPWESSRPARREVPEPVCVYYPTEEDLGIGIRIHGDFEVSSDRKRLQLTRKQRPRNDVVTGLLTELLKETAAAITQQGRKDVADFLDCVATDSSNTDPISKALVSCLEDLEIVPVGTENFRCASETWHIRGIAASESEECVEALRVMLKDANVMERSTIAAPGLFSERAISLLEELGSQQIRISELAARVCPTGKNEAAVIESIKNFANSLRPRDRREFVLSLKNSRVIPVTSGAWKTSAEAFFDSDNSGVDTEIFDIFFVSMTSEREFFVELGVGEFGVAEACERFAEKAPTLTDSSDVPETERLIAAIFTFWEKDKKTCREELDSHRDPPDRKYSDQTLVSAWGTGLCVNVRSSDGERSRCATLEEGVYLGNDFTKSDDLETFFRRFDHTQYLVLESGPKKTKAFREFLNYLGFSTGLHINEKTFASEILENVPASSDLIQSRKKFFQEAHEEELGKKCSYNFFIDVFHLADYLYEIITEPQTDSSSALLSKSLWEHLGSNVIRDRGRCYDGRHAYSGEDGWHKAELAESCQQILLRNSKWVPDGDTFVRPDQTWFNVPQRWKDFLPEAPETLHTGFIKANNYNDPGQVAIVNALEYLADKYPEPTKEVWDLADALMTRMFQKYDRSEEREDAFYLLGYQAGKRVWSRFLHTFWDLPIEIPDDFEHLVVKDAAGLHLPSFYYWEKASERYDFQPAFDSEDKLINAKPLLNDDQLAALGLKIGKRLNEENRAEVFSRLANLSWRSGNNLCLQTSTNPATYPSSVYLKLPHIEDRELVALREDALDPDTPMPSALWYDIDRVHKSDSPALVHMITSIVRFVDPLISFSPIVGDVMHVLYPKITWPQLMNIVDTDLAEAKQTLIAARTVLSDDDNSLATDVNEPESDTDDNQSSSNELSVSGTKKVPATSLDPLNSDLSNSGTPTSVEHTQSETSQAHLADSIVSAPSESTAGPTELSELSDLSDLSEAPVTFIDSQEPIVEVASPAKPFTKKPRKSLPSSQNQDSDGDGGGPPGDWPEMEKSGIFDATRILREKFSATNIRDVHRDTGRPGQPGPGCDIICEIEGQEHFIEVKSTQKSETFSLTPNERESLLEHGERYWVAFVSGIRTSTHKIRIIKNLHEVAGSVGYLSPQPATEQYRVDSEVWRSLVAHQFDLSGEVGHEPKT